MTIGVTQDPLGKITPPDLTEPHLVMMYDDRGHQIITNMYDSFQRQHLNLKLSGYDHSCYLWSFRKPSLTWSNLT